jgi:flagellar motor switch/type III secretory pathway protein FliN
MIYSAQRESAAPDERQALPDLFTHRWTGAVLLRLAIGKQVLWLALDAAAVDGWLKAGDHEQALPATGGTAPLTPLPVALRDAAVDVRVELRTVEVALGDLMTLALGDVIQTQHAIDSPMQILVSTTGGASAALRCHAYLGMRDGARAVVLAKSGP